MGLGVGWELVFFDRLGKVFLNFMIFLFCLVLVVLVILICVLFIVGVLMLGNVLIF